MPFASAVRPSIQCGLLKSLLAGCGHDVSVEYLNLELAAMLGEKLYGTLAGSRWLHFLGEWLFSVAAFGSFGDHERFLAHYGLGEVLREVDLRPQALIEMRNRVLPEVIERWAAERPWDRFDVVGFTCTFEQSLASFALARRIKERHPRSITIFGGAAFDRDAAAEYVARFPYIDYAITGEADRSLPELLARIGRGEPVSDIPGLVTRENGSIRTNREEVFRDLDSLPDPDYTDYFAALSALGRDKTIGSAAPQVLFQSARGCWWGQAHQCTFCSLNGSSISYRSRSAAHVFAELKRQSERFRVRTFVAADNILNPKLLDGLFPQIREARFDFELAYEVKANLTRAQLRTLADGGARLIQPGLESLSTRMLEMMRKGANLLLNVRLLKWAQYYKMRVVWNLLTHHPGETAQDYLSQADLVPLLYHLPPPRGPVPITVEKYSPLMGLLQAQGRRLRPALSYFFLYPDGLVDIEKLAYFFVADTASEPAVVAAIGRLTEAVACWNAAWRAPNRPSLTYLRGPGWLRIVDRREPSKPRLHELSEPAASLYEYCSETAHTAAAASRYLESILPSARNREDVGAICEKLVANGLAISEGGYYLSLAIPSNPGL
jgi:ribosomal peptide maturation radical SAM protein 1